MARLLRFGSILALTGALVLGGCGGTPLPLTNQRTASSGLVASPSTAPSTPSLSAAPAPPTPSPSLDRVAGWRADIDGLLTARESTHPDPWHGMGRADWVAAADAVKARIPELTDDGALVELVRLAAMPGWTGRDGHTGIFLTPAAASTPTPSVCGGSATGS